MLAAVHESAVPREPDGAASLTRRGAGEEPLALLLSGLARRAPDLYALVRDKLAEPRRAASAAAARRHAADAPEVLLHGDFSLRNIARAADGRELVFDFERAECGPAESDLERLWDRELAAVPGGRAAFVAAYRAARRADPGPPEPAALDYARLCCAISTLTAARRTCDTEFEAEGLTILKALT
jgi:aminoglycoside phosphotransferase (APT) family kinase protein